MSGMGAWYRWQAMQDAYGESAEYAWKPSALCQQSAGDALYGGFLTGNLPPHLCPPAEKEPRPNPMAERAREWIAKNYPAGGAAGQQ